MLAQMEQKSDTLIPTLFEQSAANQYGHAASAFLQELLLIGLGSAGLLQLCYGACVAVTPFRGRQVCPAHATGAKIFTLAFHHADKRFIGLDNLPFKIPDEDPHDISVD